MRPLIFVPLHLRFYWHCFSIKVRAKGYTNKLFKGYNLSNDQKLKIVETFDRAKNSREVKLVYSTLAESFAGKTGSAVTKINESKSIASKSVGSTKPKKVISEGNELADRFKKLAGII